MPDHWGSSRGGGRWNATGGPTSDFQVTRMPNGQEMFVMNGLKRSSALPDIRSGKTALPTLVNNPISPGSASSDDSDRNDFSTRMLSSSMASYTNHFQSMDTKRSSLSSSLGKRNPYDTYPNQPTSQGRRFELITSKSITALQVLPCLRGQRNRIY